MLSFGNNWRTDEHSTGVKSAQTSTSIHTRYTAIMVRSVFFYWLFFTGAYAAMKIRFKSIRYFVCLLKRQ